MRDPSIKPELIASRTAKVTPTLSPMSRTVVTPASNVAFAIAAVIRRQSGLGFHRLAIGVERHRDVLVQIDQTGQHEAIFEVDELRVAAP